MPVYEYACAVGHRFEVKQKISDAPLTRCQICEQPATRLISASALSFKGTGWYVTDYSEKLKPPAAEGKTEEKASSTPSDSKADSKKAEGTKSAADSTGEKRTGTDQSAPASSTGSGTNSSTPGSSGSS